MTAPFFTPFTPTRVTSPQRETRLPQRPRKPVLCRCRCGVFAGSLTGLLTHYQDAHGGVPAVRYVE